jgi:hypothetical protein
MTRQRVRVGRDVRVVSDGPDGVELEGPARLAPGRPVDIVLAAPAGVSAPPVRTALVWSWSVVRVGRAGATYRGLCRWSAGIVTTGP